MAPKVVLISLDGATDSIVDKYLANGVLDPKTGLGLLKAKGVAAASNETITPSITAPAHIAIATGSTAVNNDINANSFSLVSNPFTTNTSGFAAPIGGYTYQTGIDPAETGSPTATPIWTTLQAAGKKVVAATFPGADGANILSATTSKAILDKKEDRTVSYTVPFGAFGGVGGTGFSLTAADFSISNTQAVTGLTAVGKTSFSTVKVAKLESIAATALTGGSSNGYEMQVAAIDTTDDKVTNYDTLVVFDANVGIKGAATLPSTGSAFIKVSDQTSSKFFFDGSTNKVGTAFYASTLAGDLSKVNIARYSGAYIPRPAESPGVVANVDDINNNIGNWAPQADFRFPERINSGLTNFSDAELEAIYADQVKTFVDYQTKVLLRSIQQNPTADLVLGYIEQPDGSEHQFLLTDPRQATDFTNPNSIGSGQDAAKVARYAKYVETAYQAANSAVQKVIEAVGVDANGKPNSDIIVTSDHGFSPFHTAVSMNNLLKNAGFDSNKVRAVVSGPAVNIYINLEGREAAVAGVTQVKVAEYLTLQKQVIDLLKGFVDTNANYTNGIASVGVFDKIYNRDVPATATTANEVINARGTFIGQDTGDVFALLKTGYNFDGTQTVPVIRKGDTTPAATAVLSVPNFYGAHGYDPTLPDMKAIFYAAGPDIGQQYLGNVRNIDIAPTIEKILNVTPAATVNGTALNIGVAPFADVPGGDSAIGSTSLGQKIIPTGFIPTGVAGKIDGVDVPIGGLSGLTYDAANNRYYAISDDRSQVAPARFYTLTLDPNTLATTGVTFTGVTTLKDTAGKTFTLNSLDTEGIALTNKGTVFVSSEGEVNPSVGRVTDPFVKEFSLTTGQEVRSLVVPTKFLPKVTDTNKNGIIDAGDTQTSGVRNNLAFESLTITPDQKTLYTATENALLQDGDKTTIYSGTNNRIIQYNLATGLAEKEYLYVADPIAKAPNPVTGAADSGLVDLLAIDDRGTFLALERAFGVGVGNTIRIYEVNLQGATDISKIESLNALTAAQLKAIAPTQKRLVLELDKLKLPNSDGNHPTGQDNIEGIAFGPKLADGRQSIVLVSDNNFGTTQFTQVLALAADLTPKANSLLNGVASGDTTQTSTVLWTRSQTPGTVTFEYSTKADFSTIAGTKTATVSNPLQPVKVDVTGLTANTNYFYRATDVTGASATGKFSTAAAAGQMTGLKFGVTGDWRGELTPYPAISNADDANLKFFVELGDTIYADVASPAVKNPDGTEKAQSTTLADYRAKQSEVYTSRYGQNTWGDLRASTSVLVTYDDHEVTNDFAGGQDLAKSTAAEQALYGAKTGLINDSPLFENGLQAFQEYNPIRDLTYNTPGDTRTDGERKIYRYNTFGNDAATFVLDARSFRDTELPGVTNLSDPAQVGAFLAKSFDPTRTLLGKQQVQDLKTDLLNAQNNGVTWKFIMVPEPIENIGILGAGDRFEGYAAERTEILKYVNDNNISNVVFVAADFHGTLVNNLTYQTAPGQAQIATSAFEIVTGSVAYDKPFGPTVAELAAQAGLITAAQKAQYDALPAAGKDAFIKNIVDGGLAQLGYDPLGLDKNLAQANGLINAKLLQGDYVATNTYGWTEFNIDKQTQKLTVTTYGIDAYSRAELEANPTAITSRVPKVVSQFEVTPNNVAPTLVSGTAGADNLVAGVTPGFDGFNDSVFTGAGNDSVDVAISGANAGNNRIDTGSGADTVFVANGDKVFGSAGDDIFEANDAKDYRISGGAGNDTLFLGTNGRALGGDGNDKLFVGTGGGNILSGGAGADQFWIANAELPGASNTIVDFQIGTDVIGIQGAKSLGISATSLTLTQVGADTSINFGGQTLALLTGIQATSLTPGNSSQFVFT
jgi:phosphodiesterase/alkaline phosphatase D-like protein/predicted AlkP superfamily pyrophosphatase or phosphodiesterase